MKTTIPQFTTFLLCLLLFLLCSGGPVHAQGTGPQGNRTLETYGDFKLAFMGVTNKDFGANYRHDYNPAQLLSLFADYIATKDLRASFGIEVRQNWGDIEEAPIGAGTKGLIAIKRAMLDYTWRESVRIRGGIQRVELPAVAMGDNPVLSGDMGALSVTVPSGANPELTFGWSRGYDQTSEVAESGLENFFAYLPWEGEGFRMSPFAVVSAMGDHTNATLLGSEDRQGFNAPAHGAPQFAYQDSDEGLRSTSVAWWGGLSFDISGPDPFRLYGSAIYGTLDTSHKDRDRSGYYADLAIEYRMAWMNPEIFGFYSSGEDGNPDNGSETMPYIFNDMGTSKAPSMLLGDNTLLGDPAGGVAWLQSAPPGLWAAGLSFKDISITERLSGTVTAAYYQGTSDFGSVGDPGIDNMDNFLTDHDRAFEFTFQNVYELFPSSLSAILEAGYAKCSLDGRESPWGAYRYGVGLIYSF